MYFKWYACKWCIHMLQNMINYYLINACRKIEDEKIKVRSEDIIDVAVKWRKDTKTNWVAKKELVL